MMAFASFSPGGIDRLTATPAARGAKSGRANFRRSGLAHHQATSSSPPCGRAAKATNGEKVDPIETLLARKHSGVGCAKSRVNLAAYDSGRHDFAHAVSSFESRLSNDWSRKRSAHGNAKPPKVSVGLTVALVGGTIYNDEAGQAPV